MFTTKIRHWAVAMGLVAVVGVAGASAGGFVNRTQGAANGRDALPVPSGDLGEVVVYAPGELGEVIVYAPGDLGEIVVEAKRAPVGGASFASRGAVARPAVAG